MPRKKSEPDHSAVHYANGIQNFNVTNWTNGTNGTNGPNGPNGTNGIDSHWSSIVSRSPSLVSMGNERKVLVIYTGGTIGMMKNQTGALVPQKGAFENLMRCYPQMHDTAFWKERLSHSGFDSSFLVLPEVKDINLRIFYKIYEYETLLDSSNISFEHWIGIAKDLMKNYEKYDGFVVLHGTDTMSYTASALSFMFENIGKCIIITGSQIPIFEPRSDGTDNFVSSLIIAGAFIIPEVTMFFANKLFRGNRTRKISSTEMHAFDSPNYVPLVEVGIDIEVNKKAIFKPNSIKKCHLHDKMSSNVGLLRIFPSISSSIIRAFCQPPIEGIVLESFGAGNIPTNRSDFLEEIENAVKRGVIVINISQCNRGTVSSIYETGRFLAERGVISGFDMTPEAALTKLSYVLSKTELTHEEKVKMMSSNIRGELTDTTTLGIEDETIVTALARSLNIQDDKQLDEVTEKVFSTLLSYAIEHDDIRALKKMIHLGANVNASNSDGKTALHEAIENGKVKMVEYLLMNGASIYAHSRFGETPLLTAIQRDDLEMINLLKKCGAHLSNLDHGMIVDVLGRAAKTGSVEKLHILKEAGANLNMMNEMHQTPLHLAVMFQQENSVNYLVNNCLILPDNEDVIGFTPLAYAKQLKNILLVEILSSAYVDSNV